MYWKYSVKDAYGITAEKDEALAYEESLKKKNDRRDGPLYKIVNDPRKMKFGKFIEKTSLDELPQLFNVLIGDMSLIGPRPHQPREVELYDEEDRQVLTVKPGITGMAQVYGREKNSFKEEIARDRDYIENYSLSLDIAILFRTFFVIIERIWKSE
jgi:lipopolysaccharide/colanic/teichoic acid biosynthesis glycosyltransferase